MTDITPDRIFQVASGFLAAKHLFIANEIDLFELLAGGPTSLEELAKRAGVEPARASSPTPWSPSASSGRMETPTGIRQSLPNF